MDVNQKLNISNCKIGASYMRSKPVRLGIHPDYSYGDHYLTYIGSYSNGAMHFIDMHNKRYVILDHRWNDDGWIDVTEDIRDIQKTLCAMDAPKAEGLYDDKN